MPSFKISTRDLKGPIADKLESMNIKTFTELSQIGLEPGIETIDGIMLALPEASVLHLAVTEANNTEIYPNPTGTLIIEDIYSTGATFRFYAKVDGIPRIWKGLYLDNEFSGWAKVYSELDPPLLEGETIDGSMITPGTLSVDALSKETVDTIKSIGTLSQEMEEVKKSVSDGKTLVANAITDKGISTATDATFEMMAINIAQITSEDISEDATASASDILDGKTAAIKGELLRGTMPNNAAVTPSALSAGGSYTIHAGYHNGSGKVTAKDLASQTSGTAATSQILSGKTAWVGGSQITGTMADNGAVAPGVLSAGGSYTIPAGYHNGSGKVTAKDLASQTAGTAGAAQVLNGKTAWVGGSQITGTMADNGAVSQTLPANGSYTIPAGYHNGSGKVTQSLTTQAAKTYQPQTTAQTIAAGTYLSGAQTIAATTGTAAVGNVLSGKTFNSANGIGLTGTMADNGAVAPGALSAGGSYTIPAGYHNGSGKVTAKDLASQTSGTAGAAQVLSGKTAWVGGSQITGTMADNGAVSQSLGANGSYTIPAGYHNGSGKVTQSLTTKGATTWSPSTSAQTIAAGTYLSGAQTIAATTGTAAVGNVLKGKTFNSANGIGLTGTMTDNGAVAPGALAAGGSYTIPAGYHNGSGKVTAKDLASQTSGTAAASQILTGKTAWVGGSQITGSMKDNGAVSQALAVNGSYTIPAGYHNGSGKVTQSLTTKAAATYTPGTSNQTIAAGQYLSGAQTIAGDSNLVAGNIAKGKSIFGVSGTYDPIASISATSQYLGLMYSTNGLVAGNVINLSGNLFMLKINIAASTSRNADLLWFPQSSTALITGQYKTGTSISGYSGEVITKTGWQSGYAIGIYSVSTTNIRFYISSSKYCGFTYSSSSNTLTVEGNAESTGYIYMIHAIYQ